MNATTSIHPDDGTLVRFIDHVLEEDDGAVPDHVASCTACQARLNGFRVLARGWTRTLAIADTVQPEDDAAVAVTPTSEPHASTEASIGRPAAPPHPDKRRQWLRAAAVVLAAGALAAPPVRAWLGGVWTALTVAAPPGATTDPPAVAANPVTVLTFAFERETFLLVFDAPQPAGEIVIEFTSNASAVEASVEGNDAGELLMHPDGLRVRNAPSSAASYRIRLPSGVRSLRVDVAGRAARTVTAAAQASPVRVTFPIQ